MLKAVPGDGEARIERYVAGYVRANLLTIDESYQRRLSPNRVKMFADNFDWNAIGFIAVSRRPGGIYTIIDGQHRVAAIRSLGADDIEVPCAIYSGLTPAQEAWLFYVLNARRAPMDAKVTFNARMVGSEAQAVAVRAIVESSGYTVPRPGMKGSANNCINAVGALQLVYTHGHDGDLETVLRVLKESWGHDPAALQGQMIEGLFHFCNHYRDQYKEQHLIERLRKTPPLTIRRSAKQMRDGGLITYEKGLASAPGAIARCIQQVYNSGLRTNRLPAWEAA